MSANYAANASVTENGIYPDDHFMFTGTAGGSSVTLQQNVSCYCRGTLIRTETGDTPIEDLRVGDLVLTASGEARPIHWIGFRGLDCTRHPNPEAIWPIRIQAGAFGLDLPARDLLVSAGHSILVEGVLIQADTLVNDATIVRVPREWAEYWHVELESHDILLAEGLPGETYPDVGNRRAFVSGGAIIEAYPNFKPKHYAGTCVLPIKVGPAVWRAKAALLARAEALGYVMTEDPDLHVLADGKRIEPNRVGETRITFMLPSAVSTVELRSRSFIPAHVDPTSEDRRSLGICVSRLRFDGTEIALEDEETFAIGWHGLEENPEGHSWRWSCDRMPLPAGTRLVVIDIAGSGRYWAKPTASIELQTLTPS